MLANADGLYKVGGWGRWRITLCAAGGVFVCAVLVWGLVSGPGTPRAHPDPDVFSIQADIQAPAVVIASVEWGPHGVEPACGPIDGGARAVNFAFLVLDEHPPEVPPIPPRIAALEGATVRIVGHAIPLEAVSGRTTALILSRTQVGCCFGSVPRISEWIWVVLADGQSLGPVGEGLVVATGTFSVETTRNEVGDPVAFFRLVEARAQPVR